MTATERDQWDRVAERVRLLSMDNHHDHLTAAAVIHVGDRLIEALNHIEATLAEILKNLDSMGRGENE